jgi:protoporphyrinogen oxidase
VKRNQAANEDYADLAIMRQNYRGQSLWRFKSGIQTLVDALVSDLKTKDAISLTLNEPCERISFDENTKVHLKTKNQVEKFDFVICSSQSKSNSWIKKARTLTHKSEI